ncbi:MAG: YceD family protein [Candidatus Villigracilaceae bacterium]
MSNPRHPLRINVGFIVSQEVGYSHQFDFDFPKLQVADDLELRDFKGIVHVGRTPQGLYLQGRFEGRLTVECVRCLSDFEQTVHFEIEELYAFSRRSVTDSGLILPEDANLNLSPLVRDYALLEIPINPICKPDCKGLCPQCGQNLNEADCGHSDHQDDSPFAVLKDLLDS